MTWSRLFQTLVAIAAVLLVTGARNKVPSAGNSTVPSAICVVGANGVTPDAVAGQFTMVIRDVANNPVSSAQVTIDFSQCPDIELCTDQLDAGATVTCAAKTVRKITNVLGEVRFVILGSSHGAVDASMALERVRIYGNGALVGTPAPSAFDLDGSGGVGANDLAAWLADFGSGLNPTRSDYDGSGTVGAGDLSEWLAVFGAGGSASSCGAACP